LMSTWRNLGVNPGWQFKFHCEPNSLKFNR
jgi:hypothetical protein